VGAYVMRRLGGAVLLVLAISVVAFLLARALPGDPAEVILGLRADPQMLARVRAELGIDRPWPAQYLHWLGRAVAGDFGVSLATTGAAQGLTATPVARLLAQGFGVTLALTAFGTVLAALIGVPAGLVSAARPGRSVDRAVALLSVAGLSVPSFYLAYLLILLFTVRLHWLPSVGFVAPADGPVAFLRSISLPVMTIALINAAPIARAARAAAVEVLASTAMHLLRLRGTPPAVIHLKHVARNVALPVMTVVGLQIGYLLGGVIVIENMFALPGMGRQLLIAAEQRDYPTLQALVVVFGLLFVLINLGVDLLYVVIDPRLRRHAAA
jgi:peptide/nickel transport system permease protein